LIRPKTLLDILDLERIEVDIFRGRSPDTRGQRVFGGQVAGQALVAAGRTVEADRFVHSLHGYFIRPGDLEIPIVYTVDRTRDGRSFSTRRVTAIQHGRPIFTLSASFQVPESGLEHQDPMPDAPDPDSLPARSRPSDDDTESVLQRLIEIRAVPDREGRRPMIWMRASDRLPDDPLVHVCAVAYASDMTLLDSILRRHDRDWDDVSGASLDHAMWFHGTFRADEWMLYDRHSPAASGARGLAHGRIFRRDGKFVVSVVQEGLIRLRA
jgi:acyl-CoA thioesterase II